MEKALKTTRIRARARIVPALLGLMTFSAFAAAPSSVGDAQLAPSSKHEKIGELVTEFVQKSHYQHSSVDDKLSALVLDRYIESLDGNRMYLLQSDVDAFQKYRHQLDDMVQSEPMDPVFAMFEVYRTRARQRLEFALTQLETEPDFTVSEEFQFDREDAPWATTDAELDEIWRKRVKNDALGSR